MTWEVVEFGAGAGRSRPFEIRLGVTRQGGKMAMVVGVPGALAKELRWAPTLAIGMNLGTGDHEGWVRLVPEAAAYARALRAMSNSQNLRYVTPMWPWLEGTITETRPPERVEHRIGVAIRAGGPVCLDVRLPDWACEADRCEMSPPPAAVSPPKPAPFRIGARSSEPAPRGARSMSLGAAGYPQPSV